MSKNVYFLKNMMLSTFFFSQISHEKITVLMPTFCPKNLYSLTELCYHALFSEKNLPLINCYFDPKSCHKCSRPPPLNTPPHSLLRKSIFYLNHNLIFFWQNWRFLPNMGIPSRGFAWKIWIKRYKITVFLGEWTFFDKIWEYKNSLFFREWTFSVKIWSCEQWFFRENNK